MVPINGGSLDGGSQCCLSILKKCQCHMSLSPIVLYVLCQLKEMPVLLAMLLKVNIPLSFDTKTQKQQCSNVDFRGPDP